MLGIFNLRIWIVIAVVILRYVCMYQNFYMYSIYFYVYDV